MKRKNLLLTGPPRCGKSTLIETVVRALKRPVTGFFTREITEKGRRTGFEIVTLDGKKGTLAHESFESPMRVGKYGVTLEALDRIAVPSMIPSTPDEIVVIDEIGKMECFSPLFCETLVRTLDTPNLVLGSITMTTGVPFIQRIKSRRDVLLIRMSLAVRDHLARDVTRMLLAT